MDFSNDIRVYVCRHSAAHKFLEELLSYIMTENGISWTSQNAGRFKADLTAIFTKNIGQVVSYYVGEIGKNCRSAVNRLALPEKHLFDLHDESRLVKTVLHLSKYLIGDTNYINNFFIFCASLCTFCMKCYQNGHERIICAILNDAAHLLNYRQSWTSKTDFSDYDTFAKRYLATKTNVA